MIDFHILPGREAGANLNPQTLLDYIGSIIKIALTLGGVIALVIFLWGVLQYGLSFGDDSKTTKAKQTMLGAIIGIVIMASAFAIVQLVWNQLSSGSPLEEEQIKQVLP